MFAASRGVRAAVLGGCVALALTGCGGDRVEVAPTPVPTGAVRVSPVETSATGVPAKPAKPGVPWSMKEAGQQYLAAAVPANDATYAGNRMINDYRIAPSAEEKRDVLMTQATVTCAAHWVANEEFIGVLSSGRWPMSVRDEVKAVAEANQAEQAGLNHCGSASTPEEVFAGLAHYKESESAGEAQVLRAALGLPSSM